MGLRQAVELVERVGAGLAIIDQAAASAASNLNRVQGIANGPATVRPVRPGPPGVSGQVDPGNWLLFGANGQPISSSQPRPWFAQGTPTRGLGGGGGLVGDPNMRGLGGGLGGDPNSRGAVSSGGGGTTYNNPWLDWWNNPAAQGLGQGPPESPHKMAGPAPVQDINSGRQTMALVAIAREVRGLREDIRNGTTTPVRRRAQR